MGIEVHRENNRLLLIWDNGLKIEALLRDKNFLGIGRVWASEQLLRDGSLPWYPCFATPEGIQYNSFVLNDIYVQGNRVELLIYTCGQWGKYQQWYSSQGHSLFNIEKYTKNDWVCRDQFVWTIESVKEAIAESYYVGFRYSYHFKSHQRKIHYLLDQATWELDGDISKVRVIMLNGYTNGPGEYDGSTNHHFSTEVTKKNKVDSSKTLHSIAYCDYQFGLRYGRMQPFDFQFTDSAVLLGYWEHPNPVKSWIVRHRSQLLHFDHYAFSLSNNVSTTWKRVLVDLTSGNLTDRRNQWTDIYNEIRKRARAFYNIPTKVTYAPWVFFEPLLIDNKFEIYKPQFHDAAIKRILPRLADMGFKLITTGPYLLDTQQTRLYHLDDSMRKAFNLTKKNFWWDYGVCTMDYRLSPLLNGLEEMRRFVKRAHELGIKVITWFGSQLGILSPILYEHPEWGVRQPDGKLYMSVYHFIVALRLDLPNCRDWLFKCLKNIREQTGMDGFFWDSFADISLDSVHWEDNKIKPMFNDAVKFLSDLRQDDCELLLEGVTPFDNYNTTWSPDFFKECDYLIYGTSSCWPWEELGSALYYRYLGLGSRPSIKIDPKISDKKLDEYEKIVRRANLDFNLVAPWISRRELLENDFGVLWWDVKYRRAALFCFNEFQFTKPGIHQVYDLSAGNVSVPLIGDSFRAISNHTYVIEFCKSIVQKDVIMASRNR